jgi:putative YhbY family RNA-binding protein
MNAEKPTILIGKKGLESQTMNEVSRQLDRNEIVKVKVLKTALKDEEAKNLAAKIAQETASSLIDVRGHTFVLYKPKKERPKKPS